MSRSEGAQLTLELGHRPSLGGADFLVAACNREAVSWLDRWPDWPGPALVIFGPSGCGKSHLGEVFRTRAKARVLEAADLACEDLPGVLDGAQAVLVDDADRVASGGGEEPLLHLYNLMREAGGHLLLTAKAPPARWGVALADLASRLNAAPAIAIGSPDDALIAAVLVKQFADRQLRIDADVGPYLAARIERSFAAVSRWVAAIDAAALKERRNITVPFVRRVLENGA